MPRVLHTSPCTESVSCVSCTYLQGAGERLEKHGEFSHPEMTNLAKKL